MKAVKKTVTIVISAVLWIIILMAALYAFTTMATRDQSKVASLAGYTPMVVKSDSMKPTFSAGDLIFIRKCNPADLEEGDIVCFHTIIENEYALNTHRIVEIKEQNNVRSYTTRGDNNAADDRHIISDGDIVGRYVGSIMGLGRVMDFLSSSVGFLFVIVLPMLIFFVYQVYHLIMVSINLKKALAAESAMAAGDPAAAAALAGMGAPADAGMQPQTVPVQEVPVQAAPVQSAMTQAVPVQNQQPQAVQNVQAQVTQSAQAAPAQSVPVQNLQPQTTAAAQSPAPQTVPVQNLQPQAAEDATTQINNETRRIQAEAEKTMQEAKKLLEEANAIKAQVEANAALAEAKRMRDEAESILKQMKQED
ncbi:MAG: signal peptidase I [Lachnospiraceae bacterium]|nr:signal peptidase I [Lachnospiraceae bacterium]